MKVWQKNLILIVLVVLLAALPLWLLPNAEFGGADDHQQDQNQVLLPNFHRLSLLTARPALAARSCCTSPAH